MELILLENILKLGKIGDKVVVKDGYGRNFLLKFGKALRSSSENEELVKKTKDELNKKNLEITNLIKDKAKIDVSPSQLILKNEINKIGIYNAEINFHSEVKAIISIKIDKIKSK